MLNIEQQIFKQIEKAKDILVVFPAGPEGDGLASALALTAFLKKTGKQVSIAGLRPEKEKRHLSFLPGYGTILDSLSNLRRFIVSVDIRAAKVNQIKYVVDKETLNFIISPAEGWFKPEDVSARAGEFRYDLIITIGAKDLESLGKIYDRDVEFFYKTTVINIDCQASNEEYGQINLVDLNAVATAEIVYSLCHEYQPEAIDEDIATCLLTGIIHKTRNFKTTNLTPRTLLSTSQLISNGARREEIVTHLYRSRDLATLKLWGRVLNNLRSENKEELIWSKLRLQDFQETGTFLEGIEDIIDELIMNVPNAKIALVFCELGPSETKIIAYSLKNIDVLNLLRPYGASGLPKTASALIMKDIDTASADLVAEIRSALEKING